MADLIVRLNSGTTPITVELGEYIGAVWVPRPGNNWTFYALDTYTINDLVPGLVILRAYEVDNPDCYVEIPGIILYDESATTTTSEEPIVITTTSEEPVVTTTSEEPVVTTTSSEEPAITTTSSEEEMTTTTSV